MLSVRRVRCVHHNLRDKAIPKTAQRLDTTLHLTAIAQRTAHGSYRAVEHHITHILIRPNVLDQFLFRNNLVAMFEQIIEDLKGFWTQMDGLSGSLERILRRIKHIHIEDI